MWFKVQHMIYGSSYAPLPPYPCQEDKVLLTNILKVDILYYIHSAVGLQLDSSLKKDCLLLDLSPRSVLLVSVFMCWMFVDKQVCRPERHTHSMVGTLLPCCAVNEPLQHMASLHSWQGSPAIFKANCQAWISTKYYNN